MSEELENETFADLLESYAGGEGENLEVGDQISGRIIGIGQDSVFVDAGAKVDGIVEKSELLDEEGRFSYGVGDSLALFVVERSESEIRLSKAMAGGGIDQLRMAQERDIPVQGKVTDTCKGGFRVEVSRHRAFCPVSQMDVRYVEDLSGYVGETFSFLITRLEGDGKNIVLSRRKLLEIEQKKAQREFKENVREGDVIEGVVSRVMPYGAFVELAPGVEGMVHVSELSWSRVDRPETLVQPGQPIGVEVLGIGSDDRGRLKVSLSCKRLESDPWEDIDARIRPGDRLEGTVARCAKFGAFVEIFPGVEGLVHVSEMTYLKRVAHPEELVRPGQRVSVSVKEVDGENRRISLSMRDAEGDPWLRAPEAFGVGQTVKGTVEKRQPFGLFVQLAPGISGLLPRSKIARAADPSAIERLKEGDAVAVTVEELNLEDRRITLGPGDIKEAEDWKGYSQSEARPMSVLAEKLQQAMNKKRK